MDKWIQKINEIISRGLYYSFVLLVNAYSLTVILCMILAFLVLLLSLLCLFCELWSWNQTILHQLRDITATTIPEVIFVVTLPGLRGLMKLIPRSLGGWHRLSDSDICIHILPHSASYEHRNPDGTATESCLGSIHSWLHSLLVYILIGGLIIGGVHLYFRFIVPKPTQVYIVDTTRDKMKNTAKRIRESSFFNRKTASS